MRNVIYFSLVGFVVALSPLAKARAEISFDDAYTQILKRSLRIEQTEVETEIARAQRLKQIGGFLPSVGVSASDTRVNINNQSYVPGKAASVNASINLFRSGADISGVRAASRDIASREQKLNGDRLITEQDALSALFDVVAKTKETEIVAGIVKLREEALRIAHERYDKGLLPNQEVDKVSIELENSRARFVDAQTSEASARATLRVLLGRDDVAIAWPWAETLSKETEIEARSFDVTDRPDFRQANLTVDAESLRRAQSVSLLFPSVDLSASYGDADLSDPSRRDWSTILTLSVPIFDGFKSWSSYQIQSLTEQSARIAREQIKRQAPAENDALRLAFRVARESAVARERTSRVTAKLFNDGFQRFRLGRASVNDLALDQNRLFESQLLEVQGWQNAHVSFARLCHSYGLSVVSGAGLNSVSSGAKTACK